MYACRKCNKTKSDKELSLTLDPCKDDIYNGEHPQIEKHGEEDHYAVRAQTEKGRRFIENLELNSKFYRRMRKEQQEGQKIRAEISKILKADFEKTVYVEFEGKKYPTFSCWDSYLTGIYQDYMVLPPEQKRQTHGMEVYLDD